MTAPNEAAAIARGLTKAQREGLVTSHWRDVPGAISLIAAGIIAGRPHAFTPLGLAVRAILKDQTHD